MVEITFKGGSTGHSQFHDMEDVADRLSALHGALQEAERDIKALRMAGIDVRLVVNGGNIYATTVEK